MASTNETRRNPPPPRFLDGVFASRDDAAGFVRLLLRSCSEPGGRIPVVMRCVRISSGIVMLFSISPKR